MNETTDIEEQITVPDREKRIDYIEFGTTDIQAGKAFYAGVFGWSFRDFGPDYASFEDGRLAGGLRKQDSVTRGGPLVVIYTADLESLAGAVKAHGGKVVVEAFDFPGGRRFHFTDPSGNELAAWSEG